MGNKIFSGGFIVVLFMTGTSGGSSMAQKGVDIPKSLLVRPFWPIDTVPAQPVDLAQPSPLPKFTSNEVNPPKLPGMPSEMMIPSLSQIRIPTPEDHAKIMQQLEATDYAPNPRVVAASISQPGMSAPSTGKETFGITPAPKAKVENPKEKVPGNSIDSSMSPDTQSSNKSLIYRKAVITGYHPGEDGGTIAYTSKTGERPVRTGVTAATNKKDIPAGSVLEILDVNGKSHYRMADDTLGSAQYTAAKRRGLSGVPVIDLAVKDANEATNLTKLFGNKATQYRVITDSTEINNLKKQGLI